MSHPSEAYPELTVQTANIRETHHGLFRRTVVAGSILVASVTGIVACSGDDGGEKAAPTETAASTVPEFLTTMPEACNETWEMTGVDHGENHRWFANGIEEIRNAETDDDAKNAAQAWIHGTEKHPGIKHDEQLLAAGYNALKNVLAPNSEKPDVNAADLKDKNGCATDKAVSVVTELTALVATAEVHVSTAPADGVNTGTDGNGNVTKAAHTGVSGTDEERKAIVLSTQTEQRGGQTCTVYIMERCGQIVILESCVPLLPHSIIEGKTDDGKLPGDGTEASQDKGTPDSAGDGPAGQTPDDDGYLPQETSPDYPTTTTTKPKTTTTTGGSSVTTGTQPTATSTPPTTGVVPPDNTTTPTVPPVN